MRYYLLNNSQLNIALLRVIFFPMVPIIWFLFLLIMSLTIPVIWLIRLNNSVYKDKGMPYQITLETTTNKERIE